MSMKRFRAGFTIVAAIGVLALSGCAGNPDLSDLEANLAGIDGVNGAMAYTTHSGAPWNTQVVVMLFLDDSSDQALIASTEAAAPVLAEDPSASRHEVSIAYIDGERSAYTDRSDAYRDDITIMPVVSETLGVADSGPGFLRLSPDDVRRIADGS